MVLLVSMPRRTSRTGLVDALSAHYGSRGRLADHRRQFEKTTRSAGEDPSIFAIALETLAAKAFGDMGQTVRMRLIRDRFIAGHSSCDLHRYLDSVPPETPIRDVVDRCRVWESHADPEIRRVSKPGPEPIYPAYVVGDSDNIIEEIRVAAVTKPKSPPDQVEDLLRRLLAGMASPAPIPTLVPEVPMVEKLLPFSTSGEQFVPQWTVWRQVWSDSLKQSHSGISTDVLLFSDINLSLVHHSRLHKRGLPHVAFRRDYMARLRTLLPSPVAQSQESMLSPVLYRLYANAIRMVCVILLTGQTSSYCHHSCSKLLSFKAFQLDIMAHNSFANSSLHSHMSRYRALSLT